ncbi:MAG: hypothetical protein CL912_12465 [Deltaproteobacteria bacterium]|nr:hypothetical protein [Deltaproteobacteria bacterium]
MFLLSESPIESQKKKKFFDSCAPQERVYVAENLSRGLNRLHKSDIIDWTSASIDPSQLILQSKMACELFASSYQCRDVLEPGT